MTDKDLTYIERYLTGDLSESETNQFLNKMKTDSQFLIEVEKQKFLLDGISTYGNRELKARLSKLSEGYSKSKIADLPKQTKRISLKKIIAAAAVILAISTFVTMKYFNNSTSKLESNQVLFAQYFSPIELSNTRSISETIDISSFNNGDYKAAIPDLQEVLKVNPARTDIAIALANSFYSVEASQEALQVLTPIIQRNDPIFSDQAKWYSALCYLKLENEELAMGFLNDLAQNSSADFHKEAKELIKELK
jgi:tetratricopeptide (TPR) repeat protein